MSDLALTWSNDTGALDLAILENDLQTSEDLETAVLLSLFTDRRAEDSDVLPIGQFDRRGWWADGVPVTEGDKFGSRLWLLGRAKDVPDTYTRARQYVLEALQWMIDDQISDSIKATATRLDLGNRQSAMLLSVTIQHPAGPSTFRYSFNWIAQLAKRIA